MDKHQSSASRELGSTSNDMSLVERNAKKLTRSPVFTRP